MTVGQATGRPTAKSFYLFLLGRGQIRSEEIQSFDEAAREGAKGVRHWPIVAPSPNAIRPQEITPPASGPGPAPARPRQ
jgi:hypothetical protein